MKCSQCENTKFYNVGLSFNVDGDARLSYRKNSQLEVFACTSCGHLEWFDKGLVNENQKLIEKSRSLELEIAKLEQDKLITFKQADQCNAELIKFSEIINNENNSVKMVTEAKTRHNDLLAKKMQIEYKIASIEQQITSLQRGKINLPTIY